MDNFVVLNVYSSDEVVEHVRDPAVHFIDGTAYLFFTGGGIRYFRSDDWENWTYCGEVLNPIPDWIKERIPEIQNLWAPDIAYYKGRFLVYYCGSRLGRNESVIGLASNVSLNPEEEGFQWIDDGKLLETFGNEDWNALDPAFNVDVEGRPWMSYGSWWSGLKLLPLDSQTARLPDPCPNPIAIATQPPSRGIEGPYILYRAPWYYLFVSHGTCGEGANSTYRIAVGRSETMEGPYLDEAGVSMMEGGGTVVLNGYGTVRGPGHHTMAQDGDQCYMVHHWYDAQQWDETKWSLRPVGWDSSGWPVVGEPVRCNPRIDKKPFNPVGKAWKIRVNFNHVQNAVWDEDGTFRILESALFPAITGQWSNDDGDVRITLQQGGAHAAVEGFAAGDCPGASKEPLRLEGFASADGRTACFRDQHGVRYQLFCLEGCKDA